MTPNLSPLELLSTTRAVRRRLDLARPVDRSLVERCVELALQAPTGGNRQRWSFVVVTDPERRSALGELYRRGFDRYRTDGIGESRTAAAPPGQAQQRVVRSARYLADRMGEVPVIVVPCIGPRTEGAPVVEQASTFGSVLPAVWNFMLAARSMDLGTAWTTVHLFYEREAAEVLGIPFDEVQQVAMIPLAHIVGDGFSVAPRPDVSDVVHWDTWSSRTTG